MARQRSSMAAAASASLEITIACRFRIAVMARLARSGWRAQSAVRGPPFCRTTTNSRLFMSKSDTSPTSLGSFSSVRWRTKSAPSSESREK